MIEQHNSLAEKFLKKGFWLYFFSFIIAPIGYIIKIIISWELTVSEVGILYGIISLITIISAYNDLWMTESLNHFIPQFVTEKRYDKVKSILFYALFIQIITSVFIASFFYFWADFIANNYFKTAAAVETLKIFAFFFIWLNIFQTISQFFMAIQDTFTNKIAELFRMLFVLFSVLFIFLWDSSSLVNYSYTWLIWLYIWLLIAMYIWYKKYYKKYFLSNTILFDKKLIKKITKYASFVFIWASSATILGQIDMQMIIYLLWTTEAWYYTNYLSIIWIPFIIIWPIFAFLFPVFSELYSKWEINKIKTVKKIFVKNFIVIAIAFNILFFIFAEIIAFILFWAKFITSWVILKYSILFLIFNFLLQINFHIMAGIWKVKERVKIIFIVIIFNIIMNIILIKTIWVNWAALATWLWWILFYILTEYYLWKKYYVNFDYIFLTKNIVIMWLLWFFSYYYIINMFNWLDRINSLIFMFIISIIWFILFWILNKNEFKKFTTEITKIKNN